MPESAQAFIARKAAQWEAERERVRRWKDIGRKGTHDWITARAVPEARESRDEQAVVEAVEEVGRAAAFRRLAAEHLGPKGISVLTSRRRASRRYG
jgi:hypothetical protein